MSRSRRPTKVRSWAGHGHSCPVCYPLEVRDAAGRAFMATSPRALDVAEDLAAIDLDIGSWMHARDIADPYPECCGVCPWFGPCPHCDLPPVIEDAAPARAPLRAPLAEIARAA